MGDAFGQVEAAGDCVERKDRGDCTQRRGAGPVGNARDLVERRPAARFDQASRSEKAGNINRMAMCTMPAPTSPTSTA